MKIKNLTSYKYKDEWEVSNPKILVLDESSQLKGPDSTQHNVEITYEIKASIHCAFDHSRYPFDVQICNLTLGSRSFGAIFVLENYDQVNTGNLTYIASNFHVSTNFFDNQRHTFGNNTIGITFTMTHSTISFILMYYIPCIAIVIISMMSFTIPLTNVEGRIALLVTQFLTLTNLFIYEMVS